MGFLLCLRFSPFLALFNSEPLLYFNQKDIEVADIYKKAIEVYLY